MQRWFKPLTGKAHDRDLVAFDVEGGGGPGGFVCGTIHDKRGGRFYTSAYSMYQDLLQYSHRRAWVFAHNLQYVLPLLEVDGFPRGELLFTRHGLLWSTYEVAGRTFRLYDSLNLFPRMSIAALGTMLGVPEPLLPGTLKKQLAQGRPFEFNTPTEQELIQAYCKQEAGILYLALEALQELALEVGGQLKPTIAGTAMDVFRRTFQKWPWPVVGPATNQLTWPAYYGGRCENYAFGQVPGVNAYDVTSLYPFVQSRTKYPHPRYLKLEVGPRSFSGFDAWEGVAECTIQVPEMFVPPLPHRYSRRLFFPTGLLHGAWPLVELRHALEVGCEIRSVEWVLGSQVTFNPFEGFVERLFEIRQGFIARSERRAGLIKLLLNSLYGRWGLSPGGGLYTLVNLDREAGPDLPDGAVTVVNSSGIYAYTPLQNLRQPDYVNLLFAAQIAAAGRLHLLKEMEYQNENMAYCDTDSILTLGVLEEGQGLGSWRREAQGVTADLLSPKEYSYTLPGGETAYKVKGVPLEYAEAYFKTGIVRYQRALSVREAIARNQNPSEWVQVIKRRQGLLPKRFPLYPIFGAPSPWVSSRPYLVTELALATAGMKLPADGEAIDLAPRLPREPQAQQQSFLQFP